MDCPVCKNVKLLITDKQGIEIDYCPECRGIWLDRGELDKIIEKSAKSVKPSVDNTNYDRGYSDDYHKYGYKRKKRGGFLEDLFDF